jgi:hypothetical protein
MVIKDDWVHVCQNVKDQCIFVTKGLITKLDRQFLTQNLMSAINIIYPQYWLQPEVISMFHGHLQILKAHYCHAKITQPNGVCHPTLLDVILLEQ